MVRFHLVESDPEIRLFATPMNFDADAPLYPISEPFEYAGDLAREIGPYFTTGMVEDHAGLKNERLTEAAFLDECEIAWRERRAMMLNALASFDDGLFYVLYDTPDRIQHLFWRYLEPDHPANRDRGRPFLRFGRRRRLCPVRRSGWRGARTCRRPDARRGSFGPRFQQLPPRRRSEPLAFRPRLPRAQGRDQPGLALAICSAGWTGTEPAPMPSA